MAHSLAWVTFIHASVNSTEAIIQVMNPEKKDTVFHVAPPHMAPVDFSEDGLSLCPTTQAQCGLRGGPVHAVRPERGSADVFAASHAVSNRDTEA